MKKFEVHFKKIIGACTKKNFLNDTLERQFLEVWVTDLLSRISQETLMISANVTNIFSSFGRAKPTKWTNFCSRWGSKISSQNQDTRTG